MKTADVLPAPLGKYITDIFGTPISLDNVGQARGRPGVTVVMEDCVRAQRRPSRSVIGLDGEVESHCLETSPAVRDTAAPGSRVSRNNKETFKSIRARSLAPHSNPFTLDASRVASSDAAFLLATQRPLIPVGTQRVSHPV